MSNTRSDGVYEKWRDSVEKFDYFFLGTLGALCAFISQTYKPEKIGMNSGTAELIALLILVLGVVFGFRRIESTNIITSINHKILYASERRGAMVAIIQNGNSTNIQTGEIYTPELARTEADRLTQQMNQLEFQIEHWKKQANRTYKLRNMLTFCGFLILVAAKVLSAYPALSA